MISRPEIQPRIAVLLSGEGTGLQNLLERMDAGEVPGQVCAVISSRTEARGLDRARERGIPAIAVPRDQERDEYAFNDRIHEVLRGHRADLAVLLGFLSRFQPRGYEGRVMSVHPSLIPAFSGRGMYGHHVHKAAIARGVKISGATVHMVDEDYDTGPILLQKAVPVEDGDGWRELAAKVKEAEHELVPEAIRLWTAAQEGDS